MVLRACVRACVHACVRVCVRACVPARACAHANTVLIGGLGFEGRVGVVGVSFEGSPRPLCIATRLARCVGMCLRHVSGDVDRYVYRGMYGHVYKRA